MRCQHEENELRDRTDRLGHRLWDFDGIHLDPHGKTSTRTVAPLRRAADTTAISGWLAPLRYAEDALPSCPVACACRGRHLTSLPVVFWHFSGRWIFQQPQRIYTENAELTNGSMPMTGLHCPRLASYPLAGVLAPCTSKHICRLWSSCLTTSMQHGQPSYRIFHADSTPFGALPRRRPAYRIGGSHSCSWTCSTRYRSTEHLTLVRTGGVNNGISSPPIRMRGIITAKQTRSSDDPFLLFPFLFLTNPI